MPIEEQEALHLIKLYQAYSKNFWKRMKKLREALKTTCTHSTTQDYRWEHDNGYGRQHRMTGKRCVACEAIQYYEHSSFTHDRGD